MILTELMTDHPFDEVGSTIKEVNIGKVPGLDGIPVELLSCCAMEAGDNVGACTAIYAFVIGVWHGDPVPQDWVDAILMSLYKCKGCKSN